MKNYRVETTETGDLIEYCEDLNEAIACVCKSYIEDEQEDGKRIGLDIYKGDERIYCSLTNTDDELISMYFVNVLWASYCFNGDSKICENDFEAFFLICSINKYGLEEIRDEEDFEIAKRRLELEEAEEIFANKELTICFE